MTDVSVISHDLFKQLKPFPSVIPSQSETVGTLIFKAGFHWAEKETDSL